MVFFPEYSGLKDAFEVIGNEADITEKEEEVLTKFADKFITTKRLLKR